MSTELVKIESGPVTPTPAQLLASVVERGVTADNAAALEKLADLCERFEAREAERQFAAAFSRMQAALPVIVASTVIPNRGKYERFEDVMRQVQPVLAGHGFSVSFSQATADGKVTVTCHLSHAGGHTRSNDFTVRIGRKADSDTQADCMAATTAKRNALLNACNIVIRQDALQDEEGDARLAGETIGFEESVNLRERVEACGANVAAFLKFAGAATFAEIFTSRMDDIEDMLSRKERAHR